MESWKKRMRLNITVEHSFPPSSRGCSPSVGGHIVGWMARALAREPLTAQEFSACQFLIKTILLFFSTFFQLFEVFFCCFFTACARLSQFYIQALSYTFSEVF
jgi:hypothetical protein